MLCTSFVWSRNKEPIFYSFYFLAGQSFAYFRHLRLGDKTRDFLSVTVLATHLRISYLILNGQCHDIFCFWFFSSISFPPASKHPNLDRFEFFRKFVEIFAAQGCRWQMKKIFNQKHFNNFVGTPLDSRVKIYIHFCLQVLFKVSAAWY